MPAASDPHSPLLLPTSNLLDLDTLLPHIGQCLGGDDDCDFDGADDVHGDEEGKKVRVKNIRKILAFIEEGEQQEERSY